VQWEQAARAVEAFGVRCALTRIGVVLAKEGGALKQLWTPFSLGIGGPVGDGRQWMSWIHLEDLAGLFRFALESRASGAINGTAPQPVTNAEFTKTLAATLHRPAIFPVPTLALKMVFGEMAEVVLASQRVIPKAAEEAGYRFRFPQLAGALADVLK
jgi:hypothetical protein